MFQHFYHETLRRVIAAFGTLFNNIYIKHKNDEGEIISTLKVPIAYGPTQKFLARLEQSPNLNKPIQITLPRLSMELVNLSYDSSRQTTATQSFIAPDKNKKPRQGYLPVAYTLFFELGIFTKLEDDMFQIVEQILPYFRPSYTVSITLLDDIEEKRDIVFTLTNIRMTDDYEGNFETRRSLIWTLSFSADIFFFIPISPDSVEKNIIQKVSFGLNAGDSVNGIKNQDIRFSTTPRATRNYTGTVVTKLAKEASVNDNNIEVLNSENIVPKTYISINNETLFVNSKQGNSINVIRGFYGTDAKLHINGSDVLNITTIDNTLIPPGDPFSFINLIE